MRMEVELHTSLLSDQTSDTLLLLALCAFGMHERHVVLVDDRVSWNRWAETFPVAVRDELQVVWERGEQRASLGPPRERIRVLPNTPVVFNTPDIAANPSNAFALLGRPLRILLENGRNDRAFLLAFADRATHDTLIEAEQAGWLAFETAGGIGELKVRLLEAADSPMDVMRTMYLCDSDVRTPAALSTDAESVSDSLEALHREFHRPPREHFFGLVLTRRSAENYAPPGDVLQWACSRYGRDSWDLIRKAGTVPGRKGLSDGPGSPGGTRRQLLAAIALRELPPEIRAFLDFKEGYKDSNGNIRTDLTIWKELDSFQQCVLRNGFGKTFSASFYSQRKGLVDETGEIQEFVRNIARRF